MAAPQELTAEEWQVIHKLRWLKGQSPNFKLTIYGQGSHKRCILDLEPSYRVRLSQTDSVHPAIDD